MAGEGILSNGSNSQKYARRPVEKRGDRVMTYSYILQIDKFAVRMYPSRGKNRNACQPVWVLMADAGIVFEIFPYIFLRLFSVVKMLI